MGSNVRKQGIVSAYAGGGDNLISNSGPTDVTGWSVAGTDWSRSLVNCSISPTGKAIRATYSGTGTTQGGVHHAPVDYTKLENGKTYTLSAWIRASKNCTVAFKQELMTGVSDISVTTQWKKYIVTKPIDTSLTYHSDICYVRSASVESGVWIEIFGMKLEESSIASAWSYYADADDTRHGLGETGSVASVYDDYI